MESKTAANKTAKAAGTITKRRYEVGEYDSGTGMTRTYFRYFNTHKQATRFSTKFGHTVNFVAIETFARHTEKEW